MPSRETFRLARHNRDIPGRVLRHSPSRDRLSRTVQNVD